MASKTNSSLVVDCSKTLIEDMINLALTLLPYFFLIFQMAAIFACKIL